MTNNRNHLWTARTAVAALVTSLIVVSGVVVTTAGAADAVQTSAAQTTAIQATGVRGVVKAATAFARSLTKGQKWLALLDLDSTTAPAWSDEACGRACRGGVALGDLSGRQQKLALALLRAAVDGSRTSGYGRIAGIRAAQVDPGRYYLALLGTPSVSGAWQLHFGGRDLALNFTYEHGRVIGSTPFAAGLDPAFGSDGENRPPLADMAFAMRNVIYSLDTAQLTAARLDDEFTGVLLGPGQDGRFPDSKQGIRVGTLEPGQQKLVLNAVARWVGITDPATHRAVMRSYKNQLARTYLAWAGETDLAKPGDYVRIDGPGVWIEFAAQAGMTPNAIRYQTVWRDHRRDYGGALTA